MSEEKAVPSETRAAAAPRHELIEGAARFLTEHSRHDLVFDDPNGRTGIFAWCRSCSHSINYPFTRVLPPADAPARPKCEYPNCMVGNHTCVCGPFAHPSNHEPNAACHPLAPAQEQQDTLIARLCKVPIGPWIGAQMHRQQQVCGNELPCADHPQSTLESIARELLRLYDWRFELAEMEKHDAHDPTQQKKLKELLIQYGREKKAAWQRLREWMEGK